MIRKISFGPDYKDAMHYQIGQPFGKMTISLIRKISSSYYQIWVTNEDKEEFIWKEIVDMPVVVEMDINAFS